MYIERRHAAPNDDSALYIPFTPYILPTPSSLPTFNYNLPPRQSPVPVFASFAEMEKANPDVFEFFRTHLASTPSTSALPLPQTVDWQEWYTHVKAQTNVDNATDLAAELAKMWEDLAEDRKDAAKSIDSKLPVKSEEPAATVPAPPAAGDSRRTPARPPG